MHIIRQCITRQGNTFFFYHYACQSVVGDSQNQNMNLSLPIIGTLEIKLIYNEGINGHIAAILERERER